MTTRFIPVLLMLMLFALAACGKDASAIEPSEIGDYTQFQMNDEEYRKLFVADGDYGYVFTITPPSDGVFSEQTCNILGGQIAMFRAGPPLVPASPPIGRPLPPGPWAMPTRIKAAISEEGACIISFSTYFIH